MYSRFNVAFRLTFALSKQYVLSCFTSVMFHDELRYDKDLNAFLSSQVKFSRLSET